MDDFSSAIISGLVGAIAGALASTFLTTRSQKLACAFEFHREFNNIDMGRHRGIADELIKAHPTLNFDELSAKFGNRADSLFGIMRFYQRLWLAIKHKNVNERVVAEMFANNFYFWYYISFRRNFIMLDWSGSPHMHQLMIWFSQNIGVEEHNKLMNKYRARLADRIAKVIEVGMLRSEDAYSQSQASFVKSHMHFSWP